MKKISKFGLALAVAWAFSAASSWAQAPLFNDVSVPNMMQVSDVNGNLPASGDTLLYDSRVCQAGDPRTPIIAPDGHHVTFGEWTAVEGRALVKCIQPGSLVVVHLSGLIPNGQYTCWIPAFDPPGFDGTLNNAFTFGPLGAQDGSENAFVADADGEGQIAGILPAGPMSIIHKRDFDGCLTDEVEFHVALAYHIDGETYGPTPGPVCTWAVQRAFVFKP
ncbi:MAG: hypothetical protein L0Y58_01535 [Verrucomicrobia subdivision 3 bacterium]|nr:hypothetical protein [Limisphaerales bacterium]